MFSPYLERWSLTSDGEPIITHSSRLLPVIWQDKPAMLKVATDSSEREGALLMKWWDGNGAAQVGIEQPSVPLRSTSSGSCKTVSSPERTST